MSTPLYVAFDFEANLFNKRGHGQAMNAVFRETLLFVRDSYWALKFTLAGMALYGLRKRTKKTQIRKARKFGHQLPNVQTGDLRRAVLQQSIVRATQRGGNLTARGTFPLPDWQRLEIEGILPGQRTYLVREFMPRRYRELASRPEFRDKLRKRIRS